MIRHPTTTGQPQILLLTEVSIGAIVKLVEHGGTQVLLVSLITNKELSVTEKRIGEHYSRAVMLQFTNGSRVTPYQVNM